jgi:glycosyltransferase involved in cell wall biosynthesis
MRTRHAIEVSRGAASAFPTKWFRRTWPAPRKPASGVAIVAASYNTAFYAAQLLFSLYRILGQDQFVRIIVVDNASTDGSRELLAEMARMKLIDLIQNEKQRYHGPALNQAMNYLARAQMREDISPLRAVWVLDSDCIVLRRDAVREPLGVLKTSQAGVVGQIQFAELSCGYVHPSSMLIDPQQVWRRRVNPFREDGSPAKHMQLSLRRMGVPILDFPYRTANYVLHCGRATLTKIAGEARRKNRYFEWASQNNWHDYHGNPHGQAIHKEFAQVFEKHVPQVDGQSLASACFGPVLELELPGAELV